jgi:hypothetical protein
VTGRTSEHCRRGQRRLTLFNKRVFKHMDGYKIRQTDRAVCHMDSSHLDLGFRNCMPHLKALSDGALPSIANRTRCGDAPTFPRGKAAQSGASIGNVLPGAFDPAQKSMALKCADDQQIGASVVGSTD